MYNIWFTAAFDRRMKLYGSADPRTCTPIIFSGEEAASYRCAAPSGRVDSYQTRTHTHTHTHTHTRKKSTTHFGQIIYTRAYAWRLFITFHFSLRPLCGMSEHASLYYIRKIKIARHIGIYCAKRSRNYRKTTVIPIVRTHCALQVS